MTVKMSKVHLCSECHKVHAPKCDKCGSTRDLRSYHGPCGACAFGKRANVRKMADMVKYTKKVKLAAFADELEKISVSGFMRNLGSKIIHSGKSLATAPGRTLTAAGELLTHPASAIKGGWKATWDPSLGQGGGRLSGALTLAGAGLAGASVIPKKDPTGRGEGRLTRAMRAGVGTVTGLAGSRYGVIPGIALGVGGDELAGAVGRKIDKMRHRVPGPVVAPPGPQVPEVAP